MQGDFTRLTFDRSKHYSSVLNQQGRVALDADWNEQVAIELFDTRTTRQDVIGLCGGPQGVDAAGAPLAGFDVTTDGATLNISKGRYYAAGILAQKESSGPITEQPDLPVETLAQIAGLAPDAALSAGAYLAYLDVWERHVTALEDGTIREVALGGPDTTTRTQVMAQVKLLRVGDAGIEFTCATDSPAWDAIVAASSGLLEAQAEPDDPSESACVVPARAGFRGLENQLYRVEVHRILSATQIGIKWSRENGSVVVSWTGQDNLDPDKLTVSSTGRDSMLGLAANNWVELSDDDREKRGESGLLVKIVKVEGNVLTIDPGGQTVDFGAFTNNPKVRRWDMPADVGEILVTVDDAMWIDLEMGVQIRLKAGVFRPGDYWQIPARTFTADIEWPRTDATPPAPIPQPPVGVKHAYCRLALFDFDGAAWSRRGDCRTLFPPLTELIDFYGVGGDGQEALPGAILSRPLQVAVTNGQQPINNARVRFRLIPQNAAGQLTGTSGAGKIVDVTTGANGVYSCTWQLGPTVQSQRVEAFLVEIDGKPFVDDSDAPLLPSVFFSANLSKADQVAYTPGACADLAAATTVQQALDILCARPTGGGCCVTVGANGDYPDLVTALKDLLERGEVDMCLCLLRGEHEFAGFDFEWQEAEKELHIEIKGCGQASRVFWREPLRLRNVPSVALQGISLHVMFVPDKGDSALRFERCSQVTIAECAIEGIVGAGQGQGDAFTPGGALLAIVDGDNVRVRDNTLVAALPTTHLPLRDLFDKAGIGPVAELFAMLEQTIPPVEWRAAAQRAAAQLADLNLDARKSMTASLQKLLNTPEMSQQFSSAEIINVSKFVFALNVEKVRVEGVSGVFADLRLAAIKARTGAAIVINERRAVDEKQTQALADLIDLLDEDDFVSLENNRIAGVVSLYGMPAPIENVTQAAGDLIKLDAQPNEPGGSRITIGSALQGTIQLRGNQLVRLGIGQGMLDALRQLAGGAATAVLNSDALARLLLDGNVIEGVLSLTLARHLNVQSNEFTQSAAPIARAVLTNAAGALRTLGWFVADSALYMGNQGQGEASVLVDLGRVSQRLGNQQITIS